MAAFNIEDSNSIQTFLNQYGLGDNIQINSVYTARSYQTLRFQLNSTDSSDPAKLRYFLLLAVEQAALERLRFTALLVQYLTDKSVPVTPCIANNQGESIVQFGNHPALLFELPGATLTNPQNFDTCQQIGTILGKIHTNSHDFPEQLGNPRSLVWLNLAAQELLPQLSLGDGSLLKEQLKRFKATVDSQPDLPSGALVGSCFNDQLFFQQGQVQAITGFYFSCTDWLLLDVAQAVNEWCCNDHGELDKHLTQALLTAYHRERPFTPCENQYWQDILCFSATRFWVSRLITSLMPEQGGQSPSQTPQYQPDLYKNKLERRITSFCPLPT